MTWISILRHIKPKLFLLFVNNLILTYQKKYAYYRAIELNLRIYKRKIPNGKTPLGTE